MREIKFRAWDKEKKKMIYGVGIYTSYNKNHKTWNIIDPESSIHDIDFIDGILMECVGKNDKNGKEIYDHDLLKNESGRICQVYWNDISGRWDVKIYKTVKNDNYLCFEFTKWDRIEIVGNIHDNTIEFAKLTI